ncbi:MAG TPA: CRISPR system precrRNA processing endoribonuclease RAMP protein Cas6 [Sulfolobales archaeon]|nr:CRISPR system precrRNA processing endoribonuclease RAMP protein Cas6 [Sulfolobales archaeon]
MEGSSKGSGKDWHVGDFLVNIYLSLTPVHDVILPPLSSKVIKNLIDSGSFLKGLGALSSSKDHYKPFFVSCLYRADGERLYRVHSKRNVNTLLTARGGEHLMARVSAVVPREVIGDLLSIGRGGFETSYGPFNVTLDKIEVIDLRELRLDLSKGLVMTFKTPVILSPKIILPPLKKIMDKYGKMKIGHSTLPVPGLIFAHALRLWNRAVPEDLRLTRPNDKDDIYSYRVAVMGTALTEVIGYKTWTETVILGKNEKGVLRKARGFRGYIVMNIRHKITRKAMERALALAKYLGIGRSRGIGLGEIEIDLRVEREEVKPSNEGT